MTLRQLVERHFEYKNMYVTFVDEEKVIERVDRDDLWTMMARCGVSEHLVRVSKIFNRDYRTFHLPPSY